MTHTVDAIFENGIVRPLTPVPLRHRQRVRVTVVEFPEVDSGADWLDVARRNLAEMRQQIGTQPDSTPLIREDRERDI